MKIIEKIQDHIKANKPFFSFEYFPPKTEAGLQNLYARLDRMAGLEPCFIDITWGAGGSTSESTLNLTKNAQQFFGLDVMMHLTCANMSESRLRHTLDQARESGIQNILALRGDPPVLSGKEKLETSFISSSVELITWIRKNYGDTFCLAVGGYPESHPEAESRAQCVDYLKRKIDAGSDFVLTQLFYDLNEYESFLERCSKAGITCPVIPGILPIISYERFIKFTEFTKIKVPPQVKERIGKIHSDDELVRAYGVELCVEMSKKLIDMGAPGLHYYTLNLESSVTDVLQELHLLDDCRSRRPMPWRASTVDHRKKEEVRPIFWSNRPKSYLTRTMGWDDFPNGRWGNSFSPTYGDLNDYYVFRKTKDPKIDESRRKLWGEPKSTADVAKVFAKFCKGEINWLPWCEMPIQIETSRIVKNLVELNENGFFTINSQPQVNGAASDSADVGWGGPGGFVYQKAYVEFFCSRESLNQIIKSARAHPSITYHAVNAKGEAYASFDERTVAAVTWGVFPGKEIIQPTIVDSNSFMIWKDEAFDLWLNEWRSLYPEASAPWELLTKIYNEFFLVNVVENDYVSGDIYKVFR
jgi:methylenetetrahydrofolate reductase (NADPH)